MAKQEVKNKKRKFFEDLLPEEEEDFDRFKAEAGLEAEEAKEEERKKKDENGDKKGSLADQLMAKLKMDGREKEGSEGSTMSPDKKSGEGDDGKLMSGVAKRPKVILPEGKECKDLNGKACASFQPMCMMFPKRAHIFCKKTCKLCKEDKPDGLGL